MTREQATGNRQQGTGGRGNREQATGNRKSRCRAAGLRGKPRGNDRYYNHFTMYAAAPSSQQRPSPAYRPPKAFPFRGRWQPKGLTEEVPRPPNRDQALTTVPQSLPLQGKVAARRADGRGSPSSQQRPKPCLSSPKSLPLQGKVAARRADGRGSPSSQQRPGPDNRPPKPSPSGEGGSPKG